MKRGVERVMRIEQAPKCQHCFVRFAVKLVRVDGGIRRRWKCNVCIEQRRSYRRESAGSVA